MKSINFSDFSNFGNHRLHDANFFENLNVGSRKKSVIPKPFDKDTLNAIKNYFSLNPLHTSVSISDFGVIDLATEFSFLRSITLRTCSAEDLIIYKAFAGRNRGWTDIEGILIRQKNKLDWRHIEKYLIPLCELKKVHTSCLNFSN